MTKNAAPLAALGLALTLAAGALLTPPASAKTMRHHKTRARKHARVTARTTALAVTRRVKATPSVSNVLVPAPGTTGPARTGTGPTPSTGHVPGTVPNAVGDVR